MNRTGALALAALALCIIPPLAAAQTPCDSLEMTLVVRVEAAGATEAAALEELAGEAESVRDAVGTPCVVEQELLVKPNTDGSWDATLYMDIYGSEAELRGVAASLDGAATPDRLEMNGWPSWILYVAAAVGIAVTAVLSAYFRKDFGGIDVAVIVVCTITFSFSTYMVVLLVWVSVFLAL